MSFVLRRLLIAFVGCTALAGCVGDDPGPQSGTFQKRMPVVVDYYAHRTLHPVSQYKTGRVVPVDQQVGRERNFGPEQQDPGVPADAAPPREAGPATPKPEPGPVSKTEPQKERPVADLDALGISLPANAGAYLALAETKKRKTSVAKNEPNDTEDSFFTNDNGETSERRRLEGAGGSFRLNFEDAEIKDVLQAVMGRVLGLTYTIAPNVSGRITISSSATQSKNELLATLETVLAMQGLSLTRSGATYRIAPMSIGGGTLDTTGNEPGFGISVVPLRYSSVTSIMKLLGGFVTDADGVRIDSSRNTVIVRGPGPRRSEIVRAIKTFDGDWMHNQAVSMFELRRSRPEDVAHELTRIFAAEKDSGSDGVIEFRPVKRLRSIMVVSKNATLIMRAGRWIHRLDHEDTSAASSIFVYRPLYRDARELTKLVNGLFGQGSSAGDTGGSVSFQSKDGTNGQSGSGIGNGQGNGQQGASRFSASFSGGGASSGLGSSSSGGGSGGGGLGGNASNASFGSLGGAGGGLKGDLAEPVEAGESRGNDKLKLSADASNNTVVAYTDGETYAKIKAVLKQLDVPPLQVAVNVIIAEVQLNDELKYGVQFFLNQSAKSVGSIGFSPSLPSPTSIAGAAAQGATSGLTGTSGFNFISGGAASPNVIISALDSISKVHILSTPSIVVMENKPATLEVGNQVPVTTQQAQSNLTADAPTVNSVSYVDTGIILKIIPRVGQNGSVDMQIDQEISSVVPDATGSTTGSLTPTISKRRIASNISVKSGQNVLLAGLVTDTRSKSNGQVPFVGPQLGNLLGNTDNVFSRTELVMFLRPVIVRNGQDAVEVTQEFKHNLTGMDLHAPAVHKP